MESGRKKLTDLKSPALSGREKLAILINLTEAQLIYVEKDVSLPYFTRTAAGLILSGVWSTYSDMLKQVYGYPREGVGSSAKPVPPLIDFTDRQRNQGT